MVRPYKRRRFFIDKKFQTKYILLSILMLLFYTASLVVVLFVPYIFTLEFGSSLGEQVEAARMLLSLHKTVWPAIGVVIIFTGVLTIFVSHGVAGPVYRIKKVLAEVSAGNLNIDIKLRKYDDLKDLADVVNLLIGELRGLVKTLRNDQDRLSICIQKLEEKSENKSVNDVYCQELISMLRENRNYIANTLNKYSDV